MAIAKNNTQININQLYKAYLKNPTDTKICKLIWECLYDSLIKRVENEENLEDNSEVIWDLINDAIIDKMGRVEKDPMHYSTCSYQSFVNACYNKFLRLMNQRKIHETKPLSYEDEDVKQELYDMAITKDPLFESIVRQEAREDILSALEILTERQAQVIKYMYGLEDGKFWTITEIAENLGMSYVRILAIQRTALCRLRRSSLLKSLKNVTL
ncbi:MAG: hypothetical protein E7374_02645 [Clostridiales bacterium]|nr:hypothetical protein [Clostridiales bacterium]